MFTCRLRPLSLKSQSMDHLSYLIKFFTHLNLWIATAIRKFKWLKSTDLTRIVSFNTRHLKKTLLDTLMEMIIAMIGPTKG